MAAMTKTEIPDPEHTPYSITSIEPSWTLLCSCVEANCTDVAVAIIEKLANKAKVPSPDHGFRWASSVLFVFISNIYDKMTECPGSAVLLPCNLILEQAACDMFVDGLLAKTSKDLTQSLAKTKLVSLKPARFFKSPDMAAPVMAKYVALSRLLDSRSPTGWT